MKVTQVVKLFNFRDGLSRSCGITNPYFDLLNLLTTIIDICHAEIAVLLIFQLYIFRTYL
jgi:hypothetical protein